jgi:cellulose synthase/poly-beta-1,6-N-acetylglucosamine synthase-like glycosyltransferase
MQIDLPLLFDLLRYAHPIIFITLHTALMLGIYHEWHRDKKALKSNADSSPAFQPKVSVIIPIHNEEKRMEGLLRTMLEQNYPAQIIFIDDRSTDKSPALLSEFAKDAKTRGIDCRIITLTENPGENHKQYALSKGISEADGDYFLFTDGDCEVPPEWISSMVSRIHDDKTGAIIGPVFKKKQGKGFFSLYQCYDHAVRYNYLAGSIGLGAAGGGYGNNLIVSRKALEAAGGYDAIPPSPTEDAALISQIRKMGKYSVRSAALPDAAVFTAAEKAWKSFINQTLRWNNGGIFSPELITRFNYNLVMLMTVIGILAIPLLPFFPLLWPLPAGVFIVMAFNTIAAFSLFRSKLPQGGLFTALGYFLSMLFTPVYFTLMTLMGYLGIKPKWKNDLTTNLTNQHERIKN